MKILHIGWGFTPWRPGGLIQYAEDLMQAQLASGHEVAYFFAGRHYPFTRRPRLKRWRRHGVRMYELLNSAPVHAGDLGTLHPLKELEEQSSERAFEEVLEEWRPNLVHIQELAGLPSSLIEIAKTRGLTVLMTLQDYFLLCPTIKLFDYKKQVCLDKNVGCRCRICCAQAPTGRAHLIQNTLRYEAKKNMQLVFKMVRWMAAIKNMARSNRRSVASTGAPALAVYDAPAQPSLEEAYQRRRNVNIDRLNMVDLLVGQSRRVTEIYQALGVRPGNIKTIHLTLEHIFRIQPLRMRMQQGPVTFATLNGCASLAKGSRLILEAVRKLYQWGLNEEFKMVVFGGLDEDVREDLLGFGNVDHRGFYNRNCLDSVLEGVNVGIVPSIWEEAYGYVGVELLAKGIPVIGNKIGGIVDYVVPGQTGWLNADNSSDGLANIMASLIRSPEQIISMNKCIVANRDQIIKKMNTHAAEIEESYSEALKRKVSSTTT